MCSIHSSIHSFQLLNFPIQLGIGKKAVSKVSLEKLIGTPFYKTKKVIT